MSQLFLIMDGWKLSLMPAATYRWEAIRLLWRCEDTQVSRIQGAGARSRFMTCHSWAVECTAVALRTSVFAGTTQPWVQLNCVRRYGLRAKIEVWMFSVSAMRGKCGEITAHKRIRPFWRTRTLTQVTGAPRWVEECSTGIREVSRA